MASSELNERAQHLLKILIKNYIRDGQPVPSRTLAADQNIGLSPATIRTVLSDLEKHGYLHSLHTSSGRVPTAQGYRFYVDCLLTAKPLLEEDLATCQQAIDPFLTTKDLMESSTSVLSSITRLAGLVTLPKQEVMRLRQVEFLPLSHNRVLVILVINEREVQNRIIHTDRKYSPSELEQAANYLTTHFAGLDLSTVRSELLATLRQAKDELNQLLQTAVVMAEKAFDNQEDNNEYILTGQNHLLSLAEDNGVDQLRSLFDAFTQKKNMLYLLDACLAVEGVQIFIGEESGQTEFAKCSLITAPYGNADAPVGVIGVIGPTRLDYERVIPLVDITAKLLTAALKQTD